MTNKNELKAARIRKGYSQSDIARELGLSTTAYYNKENNIVVKNGQNSYQAKFSLDEALTLSELLDIKTYKQFELVFGEYSEIGKLKSMFKGVI